MKRSIAVSLASLLGFALTAAPASAQTVYPYSQPNYGPGYQPMLSPYLNFLRGGDPAANYFLGVVPEFQRRSNAKQFGQSIQNLDLRERNLRRTPPAEEPDFFTPLGSTGHPTAFGNTLSYFGQSTPRTPAASRNRPGAGQRPGVPPTQRRQPNVPKR